jgi:hypothetical protein
MIKQFLLNADGTIPAGADVGRLLAEGIPFVLPTPMPRQPGMVAVEKDPQQDGEGVWRQVWTLEPAPEHQELEPAAPDPFDLLATLTDEQRAALLALLTQPE